MASTRRAKRDPVKHAFSNGLNAGARGRSSDQCPFHALEKRGAWMQGWREGRTNYISGIPTYERYL